MRHTRSAGTRKGRACPAPREPPEDSEWCGPTCMDSGSSRKDGGKREATHTSSQCSWNQPIQPRGLHQCPSPGPRQGPPRLTLHTWPMPVTPLHSHRAARTIFLKPKRSLSPLLKALQHCRPQSKTLMGLPPPFHGRVPLPALLIALSCTLSHTPARLASLLHLELAKHFPPSRSYHWLVLLLRMLAPQGPPLTESGLCLDGPYLNVFSDQPAGQHSLCTRSPHPAVRSFVPHQVLPLRYTYNPRTVRPWRVGAP